MNISLHPDFNGSRIALIRSIKNISSTKLAEEIGVTKQTISQYENNIITPTPDRILAISNVLGFPPKFFFEGKSESFSAGLAYCRATTTTARNIKSRQTHIDVLKAYIYRFFSQYIDYPSQDILIQCMKDISELSDIEQIANTVRQSLELNDRPVQNMVYLLQNIGIVVTSFSEEVSHLDAISHITVLTNQKGENECYYFTTFNTLKTTPARLNFTLAHELGHWILGHISSDDKTPADIEYRGNENDANQFAAAFLLPKEAFLKDLDNPTSLKSYLHLKLKWHVSIAMMIRRAYMLGQLSPSQYQYLFRQIGIKKWRTCEPGDMEELPSASLFSAAVDILDKHRIILKNELIHYLNQNCFTAKQDTFEFLLGLKSHELDSKPTSPEKKIEFKLP